jgi:hypothetical protein
MKFNKIRNTYTDLKELHKKLKAKKTEKETERFEDVSDELDELDRLGKVDYACYADYYQMAINRTGDQRPIPSGMKAKNRNYTY